MQNFRKVTVSSWELINRLMTLFSKKISTLQEFELTSLEASTGPNSKVHVSSMQAMCSGSPQKGFDAFHHVASLDSCSSLATMSSCFEILSFMARHK